MGRGSRRRDASGVPAVTKAATPPIPHAATSVQARLPGAVSRELERQLATPLAAGLYIVATPIGNLADVSLRALAVLARAELICCEDTRHSRRLLAHFGISRPLRSYHDYTTAGERTQIVDVIAAGAAVALISDAGTPLVSDPGFKLVRAAIDRDLAVVSVPGPSAVLAALTSAGLATDSFHFLGFLPQRVSDRRARLESVRSSAGTLVLFEAAGRLAATLAEIAGSLGAEREAAIARELTKLHESVLRGTLSELIGRVECEPLKGEAVILVGPAEGKVAVADAEIAALVRAERGDRSMRDAVAEVAAALQVPRSRVYRIALAEDATANPSAPEEPHE